MLKDMKNGKKIIVIACVLFLCALIFPAVFAKAYGKEKFASEKLELELGLTEKVRQEAAAAGGGIKGAKGELYKRYLTGLSYFYEGDYINAVKSIDYSSGVPSIEGEGFYLNLIPLVYRISGDFKEYVSGNIKIRLKGKGLILKEDLLSVMKSAFEMAEAEFGYIPGSTVLVEMYSSKAEFAVASTLGEEVLERSGTIGICKFNRIMLLSPQALALGYRWKDTLVHEFCHMVVNRLSDVNCPLWLHEGIARYFDMRWRTDISERGYLTAPQRAQLIEAVKNKDLVSFDDMHPSIVYLDSQEDMSLAFSEVSSMVDFLSRTYGKKIIPELLDKLREHKFKDALKGLTGSDFKKLESKWIEYIESWPEEEVKGAVLDVHYFGGDLDETKVFVGAGQRGHIRLGDRFYSKGDYLSAERQYSKALSEEADNPVILNKLSRALSGQNKYDSAVENLKKSIKKNPNYVTSYTLLGGIYYELGQYGEVERLYAESLDINPFNPEVRKRLAIIKAESKDYEGALEELEHCLLLVPGDPEIKQMIYDIEQMHNETE